MLLQRWLSLWQSPRLLGLLERRIGRCKHCRLILCGLGLACSLCLCLCSSLGLGSAIHVRVHCCCGHGRVLRLGLERRRRVGQHPVRRPHPPSTATPSTATAANAGARRHARGVARRALRRDCHVLVSDPKVLAPDEQGVGAAAAGYRVARRGGDGRAVGVCMGERARKRVGGASGPVGLGLVVVPPAQPAHEPGLVEAMPVMLVVLLLLSSARQCRRWRARQHYTVSLVLFLLRRGRVACRVVGGAVGVGGPCPDRRLARFRVLWVLVRAGLAEYPARQRLHYRRRAHCRFVSLGSNGCKVASYRAQDLVWCCIKTVGAEKSSAEKNYGWLVCCVAQLRSTGNISQDYSKK